MMKTCELMSRAMFLFWKVGMGKALWSIALGFLSFGAVFRIDLAFLGTISHAN